MPTESTCYQSVPQAILTASRVELTDIALNVLEGSLPSDIYGHCFTVGPVGSVDSGELPYLDGSPVFNGDGMVYRLDFDSSDTARITTRLAKTPCFYADRATHANNQYAPYRFQNHGLSRFSLALGMRNQLNTALLPFRSATDDRDRLLLTYDAGRPYEIDPLTLDVVTPVGSNQEWRPESSLLTPFLPVLTTAHPCFDPITHEILTVNYGRSPASFLETIPPLEAAAELPSVLAAWLEAIARLFRLELPFKFLLATLATLSADSWAFWLRQFEALTLIKMDDFVYLVRWDGEGDLERWRLVLPDGSPVKIHQSLHQIGITEHYVVLVDTAFSIGLAEVLNNPVPANQPLEREIRHLLAGAPSPDSVVYLVRREHLHHGQIPAKAELEAKVTAQKLVIPREVLHFAVDYDDAAGDRIRIHMGHVCASDAAEWLRDYDQLATDPSLSPPSRLKGMLLYETDISVLGRYDIDPHTGQILASQTLCQDPETWGVALYTFRDALPTVHQPQTVTQMYWYAGGLFPELLTEFVVNLFEDYRYRVVSVPELLHIVADNQGKPTCLFRLDTQSMAIADTYQFPCSLDASTQGYLINSPQFVPKVNSPADDPTAGYLICHVFEGDRPQIWIFDASHLSQGPVCKLDHPSLSFGFTLHTAWLPTLQPCPANYTIPAREDYEPLLAHKSQAIQALFDQEVFPHCDV
ncbi:MULTISPECIES: carotenoid oxygenase family protein [Cyanophyceae]|uniref:carotenoid oxygenase family protein n=1 Tax=Cyanophyceae TaxID=3028117 RepID=UPI00168225CB|nr:MULTISPECIES: carotenoid oxygenase family protein [Cyanophyceae]MBD1914776.1 carotenoid oxygenase family protein [Phormidium sp. FACHB-77]MBD2030879.1 carotenoid oxygenase family protein [Phormidium sp. FACHB-322]MBD2052478.1 carotenoid oxygenase family protein [Leptolyngbya sp. FACHB-60]